MLPIVNIPPLHKGDHKSEFYYYFFFNFILFLNFTQLY